MAKKKPKNYVDPKKFYEAMCDFHAQRQIDPKYKVPDYIGECILQICQKLSYSPNFIKIPYREEMVGDAVENCLRYIDNFKPVLTKKDQNEKGRVKKSNPFSYFTQYAWNAFLRRIDKEQGKTRLKAKYVQNLAIMGDIFGDNAIVSTQGDINGYEPGDMSFSDDNMIDSNEAFTSHAQSTLEYYYNFQIPDKKKKKSKKNKKETGPNIEQDF